MLFCNAMFLRKVTKQRSVKGRSNYAFDANADEKFCQ